MKLEVGMYVRTKDSGVFKILSIIEENGSIKLLKKPGYVVEVENKKYKCYLEENILKTSHNIIDLIEVGDYVNGMKVNNIAIEDGLIFLHMDADECLHENTMLTGDDIKSIVTKEQFKSMSYKVN